MYTRIYSWFVIYNYKVSTHFLADQELSTLIMGEFTLCRVRLYTLHNMQVHVLSHNSRVFAFQVQVYTTRIGQVN